MEKFFIIFLLSAFMSGWAAPASYQVKKTAAPITIDGDLSDFGSGNVVGTITGVENVYSMDASTFDPATDFNGELHVVWDDNNVYFGVKVTVDDDNQSGNGNKYSNDNLKINPGGQGAAFYLWNGPLNPTGGSDGNPWANPSCPFQYGSTMDAAVNMTGNGTLPTYEFSIQKVMLDPFGLGLFQLSVGSEDADGGGTSDATYLAFGAEGPSNKSDWNSNPWDNVLYYPTFNLDPTVAVEVWASKIAQHGLAASPNPLESGTLISYSGSRKGNMQIFSLTGKLVRSFSTTAGQGKVAWNGKDFSGKDLSTGVYVAKFYSGNTVKNLKLFKVR